MPRRRSATKTSGKKPRPVVRADGKTKKWNKSSDIPLDEEDEFHASRDKILLEGEGAADDDFGDEDEVFALKGMVEDNSDDDEPEEDDEQEERPQVKKKATKSKANKKSAPSSSSSSEDSESEEETWGHGKSAYYSSNAAQLESDDEEGNELEEQEAKRLQTKAREGMGEDDFGLEDPVDITSRDDAELLEPLVPAPQQLPQDRKSLLRYFEKNSPETLALARDWDDTARQLMKTREKIDTLESEDPDSLSLGMIHLHYQALLTYATTLAFYLHLRASEKYHQRPELLKSHPVLTRLLTLKQALITLEELDFALSDSEDDDDLGDDDLLMDGEQLWQLDRQIGVEDEELLDLLHDAMDVDPPAATKSTPQEPPKKKRKTALKASLPAFDLVEPVFSSSKSSSHSQPDAGIADAYGEATSLQHADAADKSARRKTLRFHTSKIASVSARRQGARDSAFAGDDDIPYRDRRKEKEERLAKEAKGKGRGQGGEDLDDVEPKPRESKEMDDDNAEDSDGYYELVKRKANEKKEQKKAEYEAAKGPASHDLGESAAGPRSLTRAILSNRGLTPHRPKSVRNPRVKKRQKFEKVKRKISSQKAVYKGGISDTGRYDGEKSGISKVIKSVRLG